MSDKPASCASRKSSPEGTHIDGKMTEQSRRATKSEITSMTSIMAATARGAAPIREDRTVRRAGEHDGEEGARTTSKSNLEADVWKDELAKGNAMGVCAS